MFGKKSRRASLLKRLSAIWEAPRASLSRLSHKRATSSSSSSISTGKSSQTSFYSFTSPSSDISKPPSPPPTPAPEEKPLPKRQHTSIIYSPRPRKISPLILHKNTLDLSLMEANRRWVQGYTDPDDEFADEPPILSDSYSSRVIDLVIQYEQQSGRPYTGPGAAWVAEAKAARQAHDGQLSSAVPQAAPAVENQPPRGVCYDVLHDKVEMSIPLQATEPNRQAPQSTPKQGSPRRVQELSGRPKPSPLKSAHAEEAKVSLVQRSKKDQENVLTCREVKSTKDVPVPTSEAPSEDMRDSLATNFGAKQQVNDLTKVTEAQPRQYWLGRLVTLINAFHYEDSFDNPDIATGFRMLSSYSRPLGDASSKPSLYRTKRAFMVLENECVTDEAAASLCEFRDEYIRHYGDRWME